MPTASGSVKPIPAARKARGRFHHGDLREAALALALAEIERHGHDALSVNQLAARLGVTGPAVYAHFADRRALLIEVGHRGFARFEAELTAAYEAAPDHWAGVLAIGRTYVSFAAQNPGWYRLQFAAKLEERPRVDLQRTPARYQAPLAAGFRAAFRRQHVRDAHLALLGVAHGLAMLVVERTLTATDPDVDRALVLHVNGLRALSV